MSLLEPFFFKALIPSGIGQAMGNKVESARVEVFLEKVS